MKKGIIVLLGLVTVGSTIYAVNRGNGFNRNENENEYGRYSRNNNDGNYSRMDRGYHMDELLEDATTIEIEGSLNLENGELPTLVDGKTTYTLMVPWNQLIDLEVSNGLKVKLEGAEFNAPMNWDGTEKTLIVTKITINGKTTTIDHDQEDGMFGFGHGMMGGYGGFGFRN